MLARLSWVVSRLLLGVVLLVGCYTVSSYLSGDLIGHVKRAHLTKNVNGLKTALDFHCMDTFFFKSVFQIYSGLEQDND